MTNNFRSSSEVLFNLIRKIKKNQELIIQPELTFKDLQIDSLEAVNIIVALEDELGIEINDRDLKDIANIGAFIIYLDNQRVDGERKPEFYRSSGRKK